MAWNVTICSSATSLLNLSNKNRVDQVLGMASPPQVSATIRDNSNGEGPLGGSPKRQFYSAFDPQDEVVEDEFLMAGMECLGGQSEKKRRLTMDQVRFLERSFEAENKLEPERKAQIAKHLGLQPRQVAVWFQNRRARSKSKELERNYHALRAEFDTIVRENEKLKAEVVRLTAQLKGGGSEEDGHAQEKKKPSGSTISSNNCASVGVKIELEVSTTAPHVNGLLGVGDELSSPTITENDNSTSVLPLPAAAAAAAAVMAAAKAAETANEAAAILSTTAEDLHLFTNYMQQAHHMTAAASLAQQLAVKLEGEDYNLFYAQWPDSLHDSNLFIAHWDDFWSD